MTNTFRGTPCAATGPSPPLRQARTVERAPLRPKTVCKDDKKAGIVTTGSKIKNTAQNSRPCVSLPALQNRLPAVDVTVPCPPRQRPPPSSPRQDTMGASAGTGASRTAILTDLGQTS